MKCELDVSTLSFHVSDSPRHDQRQIPEPSELLFLCLNLRKRDHASRLGLLRLECLSFVREIVLLLLLLLLLFAIDVFLAVTPFLFSHSAPFLARQNFVHSGIRYNLRTAPKTNIASYDNLERGGSRDQRFSQTQKARLIPSNTSFEGWALEILRVGLFPQASNLTSYQCEFYHVDSLLKVYLCWFRATRLW